MNIPFSSSARRMRTSEIRDLMKYAADPAIISFAGGMPNEALFPTEEIDAIYSQLTLKDKRAAFQYTATSGYPPLLESLRTYLKDKGLPVERDILMVTTGSLQAINLVAKVLIDPDDVVLTEYPCFIGAISAFLAYGARLVSAATDENGVILSELSGLLGKHHNSAKLLYLTPYFHNPAGLIYSRERKMKLSGLLEEAKIPLIEDDAYSELYYSEDADPDLPICYTGSFSKILGPGMRLGWLLAPAEIAVKCELAKQSMDACSPTFTQVLADRFLRTGMLERYLLRVRPIYARRLHLMLSALEATMPDGVKWSTPLGGFYVWITLPPDVDATEVLRLSIEKGAVFVVGKTFDPEGRRNNALRLAFSHTSEDKIARGVEIVAGSIKSKM